MSTAPYAIIAGPANVWTAPVGTAYPLPGVTPGVSWASLGRTEGGIKVAHTQTTKNLFVDQTILPQKVIRTEDGISVTFSLAELTLERFAIVLNSVAVTTTAAAAGQAGYKTIPLTSSVDIPQFSMIVIGPSPYMDGTMQYELDRVLQVGKPDVTFKRDDKAMLSTDWMALESTAVANTFGNLRAMDAAGLAPPAPGPAAPAPASSHLAAPAA